MDILNTVLLVVVITLEVIIILKKNVTPVKEEHEENHRVISAFDAAVSLYRLRRHMNEKQ